MRVSARERVNGRDMAEPDRSRTGLRLLLRPTFARKQRRSLQGARLARHFASFSKKALRAFDTFGAITTAQYGFCGLRAK